MTLETVDNTRLSHSEPESDASTSPGKAGDAKASQPNKRPRPFSMGWIRKKAPEPTDANRASEEQSAFTKLTRSWRKTPKTQEKQITTNIPETEIPKIVLPSATSENLADFVRDIESSMEPDVSQAAPVVTDMGQDSPVDTQNGEVIPQPQLSPKSPPISHSPPAPQSPPLPKPVQIAQHIATEEILTAPLPPDPSHENNLNIIIFGETGTGKSSLINMLAGKEMAGISNDALGCTFDNKHYNVEVEGKRYCLWDTAGLNEGEHGSVPGEQALEKLRELVQNLEGGINLLVYCIRGGRFREILKVNYDLFTDIICDGKVPVAIVITGLENESPMEAWWDENSPEFDRYNMSFAGHACVTTTKGKKKKNGEYTFEEEYAESETAVRQLVIKICPAAPWIPKDKNRFKTVTNKIQRYYDVYNGIAKAEPENKGQAETDKQKRWFGW